MKKLLLLMLVLVVLFAFAAPAMTVEGQDEILDEMIIQNSFELTKMFDLANGIDIEAIVTQKSPDVLKFIGMVEKTQTGEGYGSNGKFLVPIDPPDVDSIPISTRAELEAIGNNSTSLRGKYHL